MKSDTEKILELLERADTFFFIAQWLFGILFVLCVAAMGIIIYRARPEK